VRPYKGLRYLLEALPEVLEQVSLHLVIAGEFWEDKEDYLEMIRQLGIGQAVTIFDRYVPNEETGNLFGAADVVVLPYAQVTQSGVVQMAFGFGKPVITTAVGELPKMVEHGKTGLIVPPRDSRSLAAALVSFARDLSEHDWSEGIAQARAEFSWSNMIKIIEDLAAQGGTQDAEESDV
jgi:glycosyltransferase involved in cell wall biosynthesis